MAAPATASASSALRCAAVAPVWRHRRRRRCAGAPAHRGEEGGGCLQTMWLQWPAGGGSRRVAVRHGGCRPRLAGRASGRWGEIALVSRFADTICALAALPVAEGDGADRRRPRRSRGRDPERRWAALAAFASRRVASIRIPPARARHRTRRTAAMLVALAHEEASSPARRAAWTRRFRRSACRRKRCRGGGAAST